LLKIIGFLPQKEVSVSISKLDITKGLSGRIMLHSNFQQPVRIVHLQMDIILLGVFADHSTSLNFHACTCHAVSSEMKPGELRLEAKIAEWKIHGFFVPSRV
jgi:hypothetical protein